MRAEKLRSASGKGRRPGETSRQTHKAKTPGKGKTTVKKGRKTRIQKQGTSDEVCDQVCDGDHGGDQGVGTCEVGEECGGLVQGQGKPTSAHVGCTEVERALEALGVNPENANLCTKAAIMRGHIKITGQAGDLEQEVIKEKGECGHIIIATLGDLLKQTDFAGLDYEEECGNATVTCKVFV